MSGSNPQVADWLLDLLQCPACGGMLRRIDEALDCAGCRRVYPIRDGIPVLIVEESRPPGGEKSTPAGNAAT